MLVDLGRNDLSRVCRPGTVHVERFLEPERFSHVTHLVSEVAGELRAGVTPFDLLRACFPAGTVSGAPKVRAMQLISELEGYRRGPYAGAVGYALPDGTLDTCIAIRTIVLHDGVARLQAGAGIVADSDPAAEHRECLSKLAALEAAIELAEKQPMILLVDNYDSFTYNLAHLFAELGRRGGRAPERRRSTRTTAERLAPSHLVISPGPGPARRRGRLAGDHPPARADDADARRVPRPPGDRRGVRRRGRPGAGAPPRQGERRRTTTGRASSPGCPTASRPAATTRSPPCACPTCSR